MDLMMKTKSTVRLLQRNDDRVPFTGKSTLSNDTNEYDFMTRLRLSKTTFETVSRLIKEQISSLSQR